MFKIINAIFLFFFGSILRITLTLAFGAASLYGAYYAYKRMTFVEPYPMPKDMIVLNNKLEGVGFEKVKLGADAKGRFTTLIVGPDAKLYATTIEGLVKRFIIKEDGTLKLEHTFDIFKGKEKLLIGFEFEPSANAYNNLTAWITYSDYPKMKDGPKWDGRIAKVKLSPDSDKVLDNTLMVTNLPRSAKDHLINSLVFGKDGALYIAQGSNTGMGKANKNPVWMFREETLLAAAALRLDISKLPKNLPLDAKTEDGGTYNPFEKDAPLTIFATGMRNPYDLVWHSNGELYMTLNGASGGSSCPTSDPKSPNFVKPHPHFANRNKDFGVPFIERNSVAQIDVLLRLEEGGYYGHPNPLRAEYILNRGEIDVDNAKYKGIKPDPNYKGFTYNFGPHASPNGIIEYKSNALGGKMKGMLFVPRFNNAYNDVCILKLNEKTKEVETVYDGKLHGLSNLENPLDIIEDTKTGNIYVSQLAGWSGEIILFKPTGNALAPEKPNLAEQEELKKKNEADVIDEKTLVAFTEEADLAKGKEIFLGKCTVCHGEEGEGGAGVSLIDSEWIYGKDIKGIYKTVKYGAKNGMIAWSSQLSDLEMKQVSSFVLTLNK